MKSATDVKAIREALRKVELIPDISFGFGGCRLPLEEFTKDELIRLVHHTVYEFRKDRAIDTERLRQKDRVIKELNGGKDWR